MQEIVVAAQDRAFRYLTLYLCRQTRKFVSASFKYLALTLTVKALAKFFYNAWYCKYMLYLQRIAV